MDVKDGKTGTESRYTKFHSVEVMFHVSTYLPYSPDDPQQIQRKKFIGNDLSTIGEHFFRLFLGYLTTD